MISELKHGQNGSGIYLINNVSRGITTDGRQYLNITLQDKSGVIEGKKWEIFDGDLDIAVKGNIIKIDGEAYEYKEKLQMKIFKIYKVDQNSVDLDSLIISSPIPKDVLIEEFKAFWNSIKNEDCKKILDEIFAKYYDKYIDYPAAARNHHEFYHGILHHSVSMCKVAEQVAKIYNDVDRDLLITGCMLHDIGKVYELSGPISPSYTVEGALLGHISIGMAIINEASLKLNITSEVPLLLKHMILAHHGKQEFGSPVTPLTREALLLSMIDDMDAKMMMLDKAYKDVEPGEFTDRIFAINNNPFYKKKDE